MCGGGSDEVEQSEYDKQLARIGESKWKEYQRTYKPVENAYMKRIKDLGSGVARARAAGDTASAVHSAFDQVGGRAPGSGGHLLGLAQRNVGRSDALGRGLAATDVASTARMHQGMESIIAMGRNIENEGVAGLTRSAQIATARSYGQAQAAATERAGFYDAVGTGVGYGLYNYGNRDPAGGASGTQPKWGTDAYWNQTRVSKG